MALCVANSTGDASSLSGGANASSNGRAGRIPTPAASTPAAPTTSKADAGAQTITWGSVAVAGVAGMADLL